MTADDRYTRGRKLLARLMGNGGNQRLAHSTSTPDLERYAMEFVYGDIYSRTDLQVPQRQLVVIGALVALGDTDAPLAGHVHIALNAGLTRQEISGAMLQLLPYVGFPRVIKAMGVVDKVFSETGRQPISAQT
ncbi:carboxymuconolactone decarboxylase family protein [Nocardia suismassiliense]|uniref:carboxymuconolactone decarboxylase family protein n=1 Tax=Nocardia suismassiliense TaxID=2077092 RepID=UPI000D1F32B7|nr:carboxymuconolactone decarboxylase family protein [Nocardia suismassiliense]